jgi:hypothetical protein
MGVLLSTAVVLAESLDPTVGPTIEVQQLQGGGGAGPIGTAFSYQGLLKKGGAPFTGNCDMQFKLYDAAIGGNLLGTVTPLPLPVVVTNGLFTTSIDFGDQFQGGYRYLEPLVSCPAGSSPSFQSLGLQGIYPAPYALSLRPGAIIESSATDPPLDKTIGVLWVNNRSAYAQAGVRGSSDHGAGVWGEGGLSGVRGEAFSPIGVGVEAVGPGGSGVALKIQNGGIRVFQAGIGTHTPVFIHKVNTAIGGNLCAIQNYSTVVDNALINGRQDAILIITPNFGPNNNGTAPAVGIPAVYFDATNQCGHGFGRWVIYNLNSQAQTNNSLFNVMAVVP